jgi:hypothetical protein
MKALIIMIAAILILTTSAEARHHRKPLASRGAHHDHALHVASAYAGRFAGLVADLQAMGYAVGTPGCLSSGHMAHSKHHWGGACDLFDQYARNRTRLPQPAPSVQIALGHKHGLTSGCEWRNRDCGHWEVPSEHAVWYSRGHRARVRVRYA